MPITVNNVLSKDSIPGMVLPEAARWLADESAFANEEGTPFSASLHLGDPRVLLIVGENASGKSLAFRFIDRILGEAGVTAITLSIRERAAIGGDGMAGMRRAFMYGNERIQSTGATSARVVEAGFRNLDHPVPTALMMDEPEMGLSDGYAEAMGELVGQSSIAQPARACGVCVVTHSRPLARGIIKGLGAEPTVLRLGGRAISASEWITTTETRSVEDLHRLRDKALDTSRAAHAVLGL